MNKRKNSILNALIILCTISYSSLAHAEQARDMYFATAADTEHFPWLEKLIQSIVKYNYTKTAQIAVFNLGLTAQEIHTLNNMPLVHVYELEKINPAMKEKFVVRINGRLARGWYSWKPVVLHQALQLFPYVLYLDSGIEVVASLEEIFNEIKAKGYYLFDSSFLLYPFVTDHVMKLLSLDSAENQWILEKNTISAGIQGVSRALHDSYILPVYQLASEIKNFEDNGTAPWGYGFARHDQTLFTFFARKLGLKLHPLYCNPMKLRYGSKKIYFGALKWFKLRKHNEKDPSIIAHAKQHMLLG